MALYWRSISKDGLKPDFLADVEEFLSASPFDWYVTEGYRSPERSARLYDEYKNGVVQRDERGVPVLDATGAVVRKRNMATGKIVYGPRAAPAGRSAHNFGLAVDVALDGDPKPGLQMLWDTKHAGWLWLKTKSILHPRLKNGWSFGDWPHLERFKWEQHT